MGKQKKERHFSYIKNVNQTQENIAEERKNLHTQHIKI